MNNFKNIVDIQMAKETNKKNLSFKLKIMCTIISQERIAHSLLYELNVK